VYEVNKFIIIIFKLFICKWLDLVILDMGTKRKKIIFKWKICDTLSGSEPNSTAGWNGKTSSIGPIIAVQNYVK
jgi:hypothetical protein